MHNQPASYTQEALDAEDALGNSISDGYWSCQRLLAWKGISVCTDPQCQHYDWARNCPAHCAKLGGAKLAMSAEDNIAHALRLTNRCTGLQGFNACDQEPTCGYSWSHTRCLSCETLNKAA